MMYKNAAKQIKLLRIEHDMTQEELAEKLEVSTKYQGHFMRNYC